MTSEEERERRLERLRQGSIEYLKQAIDTQKHLTTLCAGSLVLIGTFLIDIYSGVALKKEVMDLPIVKGLVAFLPFLKEVMHFSIIKGLVAFSFLCFIGCLVLSVWLIGRFRRRILEVAEIADSCLETFIHSPEFRDRVIRYTALWAFSLALASFGLSVVLTGSLL